jgi:hypothetical protein
VSIKKKFATAVATAGLLAGLFGSAFVPAARGAANVWDVSQTSLIAAAKGYDMDGSTAFDAGTSKTTADGAGTATYPYFMFSPAVNNGDGSATALTEARVIELSVVAADLIDSNTTALAGALVASVTSTNGLLVKIYDSTAGDTTCSRNPAAYATTGSLTVTIADGFTVCVAPDASTLDATGTVTISVNNVAAPAVYIRAEGPATEVALSATFAYVAGDIAADADSALTYRFANSGTTNLTDIFGADGSVGISVANLITFVTGAGLGDDLALVSNSSSDVNGRTSRALGAADAAAAFGLSHGGAAADGTLDLEANTDASEEDPAVDAADTPMCDTATEDSGDTHVLSIFIDTDGDDTKDAGELESNTVTVTCTDSGANGAILTGAAFSATSVAVGSAAGTATVKMTATDGYGEPMGYLGDAQSLDFGADTVSVYPNVLASGGTVAAASIGSIDSWDICVPLGNAAGDCVESYTTAGGAVGFDFTAPTAYVGLQYYTLVSADADLSTAGNQADDWVISIRITATGSTSSTTATIAAGAKLKKATITISAAAGKLVTVTIEKVTTGRTFTYYRKANASGVATFIIRRTGTWEVFASYGDDVTDTVTLKR